jgi:excisionase family DNA binding protein
VLPCSALDLELDDAMTRHWITIGEAAEYLQISDRTVRRLVADGELTGYRMGRSRRVIRVDLNEIDEQLMRPLNAPPQRARKRRTQ